MDKPIRHVIVAKPSGALLHVSTLSEPVSRSELRAAFLSFHLPRVFTIHVDDIGTALVTLL
jgi:hypothetical protein